MQKLTRKAITGLIWLRFIMAVMLLAPAWTLHLGCVGLLASLLGSVCCRHVVFPKHDPGLVESRLKVGPTAEHEKSQEIIPTLTAILWCALSSFPESNETSILRAFQWRSSLLGDALVAVGYYMVFLALRENRWAASIGKVV